MSAPPWPSLLRALWVSAGRAAVARALLLYLAVLIGASVLFEGNGVRPADVVQAARESLLATVAAYFGASNTRPASSAELLALCSALLAPALILGGALARGAAGAREPLRCR